MDKKTLQTMFENAVHIGHRTRKWNPKMKKFLHGEKNGIHIINLEKTAEYLERAMDFLGKLSSEGKNVLFVSTKPQTVKIIQDVANKCHMPYVISKWIPGLITNFSTLKRRIKYLSDLKEQEASGDFAKYTKKEASQLRKVIDKLQLSLGGVEGLTGLPNAVFVVDVVRDRIVVKEANKMNIPVIAVVDSNSDPYTIAYPIPGNDDAIKSVTFLLNKVSEALLASKSKK